MSIDMTRRTLLELAGAATLAAAAAGAAKAEGTAGASTGPTFATQTPMFIGMVTLRVRALDPMIDYYRDVIGLKVMERSAAGAKLGSGGVVLLSLEANPAAKLGAANAAGLYHTAFLMPTRKDLGIWLLHVARKRVPLQGFADHLVSESVYLGDPEGNGIEVYADRDKSQWKWQDGSVAMATDPLNTDSLLGLTEQSAPFTTAPDGMRIGHVHLRVGNLDQANGFYRTAIGLDFTRARPGATFLASGGYHHHVAMNVWESQGAAKRDDATTGLAWFSLNIGKSDLIAAQAQRLTQAGVQTVKLDNGIEATDPWGTKVRLIQL